MNIVFETIQKHYGIGVELQQKILYSAIIILFCLILQFAATRLVNRNIDDVKRRYQARRWISLFTAVLMFALIGRVWLQGLRSLTTVLGIASAGLLIALQDVVANLAGWVFIISRKPFIVGDRIEISGVKGDVIDIRMFQFSLLEIGNWVAADQSTGRIVHIPNGKIFRELQYNFTQSFEYIWHEIPVLLTFESDWRKAKGILEKIAIEKTGSFSKMAEKEISKAAEKYMILFSTLAPIVYTTVKDCGVLLTMRYITRPRQRRNTEQDIWENILDEFAKHSDIDFAYPTTRFYNNPTEGKPGESREK
ncbi:MAG: mechanosensitive ion channel domain-containing protein [bacterium]